MESNHRITESKSVALPLGDTPANKKMGRVVGFEPTRNGATIRRVNHFTTPATICRAVSRVAKNIVPYGNMTVNTKRDEGWRMGNEIRYRLAQANRNSRREAMQADCETPYKNRAILCRRRRRGAKRRLQHNAAGRHLLKPLPVTRHLLLTQMAQHSARAHFPFPIPSALMIPKAKNRQ